MRRGASRPLGERSPGAFPLQLRNRRVESEHALHDGLTLFDGWRGMHPLVHMLTAILDVAPQLFDLRRRQQSREAANDDLDGLPRKG